MSDLRPSPELLWPKPRQLRTTGQSRTWPSDPGLHVSAAGLVDSDCLIPRLVKVLRARGLNPQLGAGEGPGPSGELGLLIELGDGGSADLKPQGYDLEVGRRGVVLRGADQAGLFYGASTLEQWLRLHPQRTPDAGFSVVDLSVRDWPDFEHRGVMLDVSRNRVPTLATLFDLVDLLASWKINQLQLYMEHTFAYEGHEVVWRDASPLTTGDIRQLDAFCRHRFVELVPNQNSLGHMHRWLTHEPYRHLAECPEGLAHPFSDRVEPFSLCAVDPGSLALVGDLYDQLLPNFTSRLLNVGLDESFDLGRGRSAPMCSRRGRHRVYLDYLKEIHRLVQERGHQMQFWGDIILEAPELIAELPRDVIALEWGYEADHPFAEHSHRFASSGLPFYVCPGTSSWNSIAGRTENALLNLANAASLGWQAGASGLLVTDWGDSGHLQPLPVSYLGFLAGAGFAWNTTSAADPLRLPHASLLDCHAFQDENGVMGRSACDLGNAYLRAGARPKNGSILFHLLTSDGLEDSRFNGVTMETLDQALESVEDAKASLRGARSTRPDAPLLRRELDWVAELLALACRLGSGRLRAGREAPLDQLPTRDRRQLARELGELGEELGEIWLARNRPGGLSDSQRRLKELRASLIG